MAYRNKTYVAFDGDNDKWAYAYMKGWSAQLHIDFDFYDAHTIQPISAAARSEAYIKRVLRARLADSKEFILLVGESTKWMRKYVRWEIEIAIELDLPIIVVNLNKEEGFDVERCPVNLRNHLAIHGPFSKDYIKKALDQFAGNYAYMCRKYSGPIEF